MSTLFLLFSWRFATGWVAYLHEQIECAVIQTYKCVINNSKAPHSQPFNSQPKSKRGTHRSDASSEPRPSRTRRQTGSHLCNARQLAYLKVSERKNWPQSIFSRHPNSQSEPSEIIRSRLVLKSDQAMNHALTIKMLARRPQNIWTSDALNLRFCSRWHH